MQPFSGHGFGIVDALACVQQRMADKNLILILDQDRAWSLNTIWLLVVVHG